LEKQNQQSERNDAHESTHNILWAPNEIYYLLPWGLSIKGPANL